MTTQAAASTRTVRAENIRQRVPLAVIAIDGRDLATPVFGAAYVREPGVVTVALANGHHLELRKSQRVTLTYDPANLPGVKGLRRCKGHGTHEPHLRRIGTDPSATAYCDVVVRAHKAAKRKDPEYNVGWRTARADAKKAATNARITYVMEGTAAGREALAREAARKAALNPWAAMGQW